MHVVVQETEEELSKSLIYIRNLKNCPPGYLNAEKRKEFFEVLWLKNEMPLHQPIHEAAVPGDWIYLIPPYRAHQLNKAGKNGILLSFKRECLEEGDKEFSLDVFNLFNIQGQYTALHFDKDSITALDKSYSLLEEEYNRPHNSILIQKAMLRVFLLQLIRLKEHRFTAQDVNQKRVYEFMILLENNYQQERNIEFYANNLGISTKRLTQILKEKLDKTGMQLIHDRIMLEAKNHIIHSNNTIKEIAYLLGFKDRPYFSRFFKKHSGKTPESFQKEVHKQIAANSNTLVQ